MQIRNLLEITVDMKNKDDEIVRIVNLYVQHIPELDDRKLFLLKLRSQIENAINSIEQPEQE